MKTEFRKLFFLAHYSLIKTIAYKCKRTVQATAARLKCGDGFALTVERDGQPRQIYVYRLKDLRRKAAGAQVDMFPALRRYKCASTELIARLNAHQCEFCGKVGPCEVHHVRKLKDLKHKRYLTPWDWLMIARRRKTLVLCLECHDKLHSGKLPDLRHVATV